MRGSSRVRLLGGVFVALVFVGTALGANSGSFQDPTGDARPAPDISAVSMSSDDGGTVTIRVNLADRATLRNVDEVTIGVDTDQNPDTGSVLYGVEFGLDLTGSEATFLRPDASGYLNDAPAPQSFQASYSAGVATFTFKTGDVGMPVTSGFNVFALTFAEGGADTAPDVRTVNYQLVAGTAPPVPGPDRRAPLSEAVKGAGVHGKNVRLRYYVADGRGESADTIRVYKGRRLLRTVRFPLADTNPFFRYYATWKVPKKVKGKLRFCVQSVDRAGNTGNNSCAALTIK
jgi:hypothetical protein